MKQKESLLAALLLLPLAAVAALDVTDLRVESLRTSLGIDTPTPAFSWLLNSDEYMIYQDESFSTLRYKRAYTS